jgi:glutathione synthase/RimK-type ligase-like ATP-grasp enzyme
MFEVKAPAEVMAGDVADVVIVDNPIDPHGRTVLSALRAEGQRAFRFNLVDLRANRFDSDIHSLVLGSDDEVFTVTKHTKVLWRHAGFVDVSGLDPEEAALANDEGPFLLAGALSASGATFVDCPYAMYRAELKPLQLSIARQLGIRTPNTRITNDPKAAREFATAQRTVAKPLSPGQGIAPFVAELTETDVDYVQSLPTMLQELVESGADARVVVIGSQAWIWRREREHGTLDWRAVDRSGEEFEPLTDEYLSGLAVKVSEGLGLSTSVQDWLYTDDGPVFLESNAVGAWLFLSGSIRVIVPAIVKHLVPGNA